MATQPPKEWSIITKRPISMHNMLSSSVRLKPTAICASPILHPDTLNQPTTAKFNLVNSFHLVIIGTNSSSLYIYLVETQTGNSHFHSIFPLGASCGPISFLQFHPRDHNILAVSSKSGNIQFLSLGFLSQYRESKSLESKNESLVSGLFKKVIPTSSTNKQPTFLGKYSIKSPITALAFSSTGSDCFVGTQGGTVFQFPMNKVSNTVAKIAVVLATFPESIFQLSTSSTCPLIISTLKKAFSFDFTTKTPHQIGSKPRSKDTTLGAIPVESVVWNDGKQSTPIQTHILAARPNCCIWVANNNSFQVETTLKLKPLLGKSHPTYPFHYKSKEFADQLWYSPLLSKPEKTSQDSDSPTSTTSNSDPDQINEIPINLTLPWWIDYHSSMKKPVEKFPKPFRNFGTLHALTPDYPVRSADFTPTFLHIPWILSFNRDIQSSLFVINPATAEIKYRITSLGAPLDYCVVDNVLFHPTKLPLALAADPIIQVIESEEEVEDSSSESNAKSQQLVQPTIFYRYLRHLFFYKKTLPDSGDIWSLFSVSKDESSYKLDQISLVWAPHLISQLYFCISRKPLILASDWIECAVALEYYQIPCSSQLLDTVDGAIEFDLWNIIHGMTSFFHYFPIFLPVNLNAMKTHSKEFLNNNPNHSLIFVMERVVPFITRLEIVFTAFFNRSEEKRLALEKAAKEKAAKELQDEKDAQAAKDARDALYTAQLEAKKKIDSTLKSESQPQNGLDQNLPKRNDLSVTVAKDSLTEILSDEPFASSSDQNLSTHDIPEPKSSNSPTSSNSTLETFKRFISSQETSKPIIETNESKLTQESQSETNKSSKIFPKAIENIQGGDSVQQIPQNVKEQEPFVPNKKIKKKKKKVGASIVYQPDSEPISLEYDSTFSFEDTSTLPDIPDIPDIVPDPGYRKDVIPPNTLPDLSNLPSSLPQEAILFANDPVIPFLPQNTIESIDSYSEPISLDEIPDALYLPESEVESTLSDSNGSLVDFVKDESETNIHSNLDISNSVSDSNVDNISSEPLGNSIDVDNANSQDSALESFNEIPAQSSQSTETSLETFSVPSKSSLEMIASPSKPPDIHSNIPVPKSSPNVEKIDENVDDYPPDNPPDNPTDNPTDNPHDNTTDDSLKSFDESSFNVSFENPQLEFSTSNSHLSHDDSNFQFSKSISNQIEAGFVQIDQNPSDTDEFGQKALIQKNSNANSDLSESQPTEEIKLVSESNIENIGNESLLPHNNLIKSSFSKSTADNSTIRPSDSLLDHISKQPINLDSSDNSIDSPSMELLDPHTANYWDSISHPIPSKEIFANDSKFSTILQMFQHQDVVLSSLNVSTMDQNPLNKHLNIKNHLEDMNLGDFSQLLGYFYSQLSIKGPSKLISCLKLVYLLFGKQVMIALNFSALAKCLLPVSSFTTVRSFSNSSPVLDFHSNGTLDPRAVLCIMSNTYGRKILRASHYAVLPNDSIK